ncbi:hypothetical protein [Bdellovibrio sp. ArHS]|uniref:hypothetical protein n=1 Tax=Bdellovibrio sp. ArHS TaxID=1569284 RepID=UPI0025B96497|nr:hypothetical protein [Bdellovibrio sp. ArHS]
MPNKTSLTLRSELERRGIDLLEMQLAIYNKAMSAFDEKRGCADGYEGDEDNPPSSPKDTGAAYLAVANQAVGTLARYCYPTMSAVKIENMDKEVNEKVIDATEVRAKILADPFAAQVAHKATTSTDTGLPILVGGKKEE